ncbi:hypothetical protein Sjap_014872 [Stephania japonica]|uniref:DYW domain-containing protein n=1 Tax=Stephania japonica TaxID=461633 RepID=A0AAP0IIJ2_9MAGN
MGKSWIEAKDRVHTFVAGQRNHPMLTVIHLKLGNLEKNLRICRRCLSFIKLASRITNREIIVRGTNRFHHFRKGTWSPYARFRVQVFVNEEKKLVSAKMGGPSQMADGDNLGRATWTR